MEQTTICATVRYPQQQRYTDSTVRSLLLYASSSETGPVNSNSEQEITTVCTLDSGD